jgi:ribulose-5-phosphate 4-epimerase/fuculose-1-phosphate aldolase
MVGWEREMITAMGDVMREAHKRGWITTRDGNCSLRRKGALRLYITPSGSRKTTIIPETIVKIPIFEGKLILNGLNPSGELEMHWLLQQEDRTRSVLHLHPTYTIAAMRAGWDLRELSSQFPEVHRYTTVGHNVPILPAISKELAWKTNLNMTEVFPNETRFVDIVGQEQHGVCAIGRHPWDAFEHIERLEHICQIALASGV